MSLFTKFIQAVQSWRRRRGIVKTRKRANVGLEQLDHRQLLSADFTGIVEADFPQSRQPGVVVLGRPSMLRESWRFGVTTCESCRLPFMRPAT